MANSEEARTKVTNEPGQLLWVSRRNGTWWPGQILSSDQISESVMSSRRCSTNTPVKLLGKEDGSVEWYNIEKSKRIKAFRCIEFNGCIEKVKASADNLSYLSKTSVKYARREDAILHALQLEGAQELEDKPQHEMTQLSSPLVPDEVDHKEEGSSKLRGKSNLGHELSHYGVSSKDTNSEEQISRKRKMNSPNNPGGFKHLRGFKELGVGVASKGGSQVEAQSLGTLHCIDSGPAISGAATAVILGTSIKTGSEPRDVDAELVTTKRLLPYPESSLFSESDSRVGIYDPLNLFEVKVEAQRSCTSQSVPFTCSESGLNGHSIVGHPLDVEALDDGFSDDVLSGAAKVSETLSSLIASDQKSLQNIIPEAEDLKKTVDYCVPVSLIFSHLKAALR